MPRGACQSTRPLTPHQKCFTTLPLPFATIGASRFCTRREGWPMLLEQNERDAHLIGVVAAEEYARRHDMTTAQTVDLFSREGVFDRLRSQYDVLHTLDLGEGAQFAADYLESARHG
ncbi:DUF3791 domain-containing protein [Eggerthellaceae bacterium zg-887]|nr:DUF3791 domain-containing protein [Xiamenia xianingshaonis]